MRLGSFSLLDQLDGHTSRKVNEKNEDLSKQQVDRIHKLLSEMTLEEKIGQMSQIDINMLLEDDGAGGKQLNMDKVKHFIGELGIGSVLNTPVELPWTATRYRQAVVKLQQVAREYNRPPIIWGLDSVHGANYVHGASLPPQPLNLAATFNETVAYEAGRLASRDTRAAGISWLFSPLVGIALEPRWSRVYETFGEDPHLVGVFARRMIAGIQEVGEGLPSRAAACAKHFIGYSMPHNGHDRSPSWIPRRHLYQYFVPPWMEVMKERVLTVMESYTETDGVPSVTNQESLYYLLRYRLKFDGVLVTDYEEIRNVANWHHVTANTEDAIVHTLAEGSVDMSMIPWDADGFRDAVVSGINQQKLSEKRLNTSVERVLALKERLRMWDEDIVVDDINVDKMGGDRETVLDMARQSLILAKNNDNSLPLAINLPLKILVTGPSANSLIYQSGGWTWQWQGASNENDWFTYGTTVLDAFRNQSSWTDVAYSCGVDILGNECSDDDVHESVVDQVEVFVGLRDDDSINRAVDAAKDRDVVIVCVGEEAYTEKPGDISSFDLPEGQYSLVHSLKEQTGAKIVLVYFGGRPRPLKNMVEDVDAVVVAFLAGPDAGRALLDIVRGSNPSGRFPITYPVGIDAGESPYFHTLSDMCTKGEGEMPHYEYVPCPVQWPFGHGLSYTFFAYSELQATGSVEKGINVSVKVTNTGSFDGAESVLFFSFDEARGVSPEYKRLRSFTKVFLAAGDDVIVHAEIAAEDLRFVGAHDDTHYIMDPTMNLWIGVGPAADCRSAATPDRCVEIKPNIPVHPYIGSCDAACQLWAESGCGAEMGVTTSSCMLMCSTVEQPADGASRASEGWGWNYVDCLESVIDGFSRAGGENECFKMTSLCRDVTHTGSMDEFGAGSMPTPVHPNATGGDNATFGSFVALAAGVFSALLIVVIFRRRSSGSEENRGHVQFARVNTDIE